MAEYVDKEIVKEAIWMIANACLANPRITRGEIQTFFKGIPSADVRPIVRGEWIGDGDCIICSNCKTAYTFMGSNFCPNCGADMREEETR